MNSNLTLSKYAYVNDLVCQLTNNKSLQTFYILYLMADTDLERSKLNASFREASLSLEGDDLNVLKKDFTDSFKNILPLVKDLNSRVSEFAHALKNQKQAA
jgi:hypothetical protein